MNKKNHLRKTQMIFFKLSNFGVEILLFGWYNQAEEQMYDRSEYFCMMF